MSDSYVAYYAESLGHGRGILRVDFVIDGELVDSHEVGSPAPYETVKAAEHTLRLGESRKGLTNE